MTTSTKYFGLCLLVLALTVGSFYAGMQYKSMKLRSTGVRVVQVPVMGKVIHVGESYISMLPLEKDAQMINVNVSPEAPIFAPPVKKSLSDITEGSFISVQGTRLNNRIEAQSIQIGVLPTPPSTSTPAN